MDSLNKFYFELATDVKKLERFSNANDKAKQDMLKSAGIEDSGEIISLSQEQLQNLMAKNLGSEASEWINLSNNANNNSVDDIGRLGIR